MSRQPTGNKQLRVYNNNNEYKLHSVDEVIAKGFNKHKGWHCSAGARNLYIDYDGNVWVANCASSNFYGKVHKKRIDEVYANLEEFKVQNKQNLDKEWEQYRLKKIGPHPHKEWLNANTEGGWPMPKVGWEDCEQHLKLMAYIKVLEQEFYTDDKLTLRVGDNANKAYKDILKNDKLYTVRTTKDDDEWGLLGSIYTDWRAPEQWTICPYSSCGCGADVILSKARTADAVERLSVTNMGTLGQEWGNRVEHEVEPFGVEMNFPIVHQILWDITRRCNYDCDYCWPGVHNNVEPHHAYDKILQTINKAVDEWADGDEIRWNFGGGEPTMHPQFMEILEHLSAKRQWVLVTTNGSRSSKFWKQAVQHINSINMSAHFGSMDLYPGNEQRFIDNCKLIIDHHRTTKKDHWLEIKLMTPPGMLDRATEFRNKIVNMGLDERGANGRQIGAISLVPIRDISDASQLVDYSDNELEYFRSQ